MSSAISRLGDKPIAFVTTSDIQKMYNQIKKNGRTETHPLKGKQLADSTVRRVHMLLHEAMEAAVKERLIVPKEKFIRWVEEKTGGHI